MHTAEWRSRNVCLWRVISMLLPLYIGFMRFRLIEYNFWFICIKCIAIRYAKDMNLVVIANVRNKMSKQIWQDLVRTCLELASHLSYPCGHRNLTIPGLSTPRESTKTTAMEDVSTEVLEKNKEYLRSKDKAKKMMYQDIYNCICQNTKKWRYIITVCQTYSPTGV